MKPSQKIFLVSISILLIVTFGCTNKGATITKQDAPGLKTHKVFPESNMQSFLAVAKLKILGNHLGGYIAVKRFGIENYRIIFTSELGLTLFDMEIYKDGWKVINSIESLNRQSLLDKVGLFFQVLLLNNFEDLFRIRYKESLVRMDFKSDNTAKKECSYYFDSDGFLLKKVWKRKCKKVHINYEEYNNEVPERISISESGLIQMKLELQLIKYK